LHQDIQIIYDEVKKRYSENDIVVLGYSIGAAFATKLAASNKPRMLILQAPFYNCPDAMKNFSLRTKSPAYKLLRLIPMSRLIKYKFNTNENIQHCKMPIVIFHGVDDKVIYYEASLRLQKLFKPDDKLIPLQGQGHNGITTNRDYLNEIKTVLEN
jgi:uncharacterized protein